MNELPSYRTILLATDGSNYAALAERHALALALRTGARIAAIYVIDQHVLSQIAVSAPGALDALRAEGRQVLDGLAERARQVGVEVGTHLVEGRAGPMIIGEAERLGADLVIIGSHGQGAPTDIILGSVSIYVVHHSQIPVCVVRPPRQ